ncbi:MAG TPA: dihydrolipoamide acetyltransferase family protein [Spirochaetia bacterium]
MPKLGQTTDYVHLLRWLVKVGDTVKKGDALAEVETDKTTMDLECFAAGIVLRIEGAEDSDIPVGTVVAVIGEPGERVEGGSTPRPAPTHAALDAAAVTATAPAVSPVPAPSASPPPTHGGGKPRGPADSTSGHIRASPVVRHLAEKWNIDLAAVHGTGPAGAITEKDLTEFRQGAERTTGAAQGAEAGQVTGATQVAGAALSDRQKRLGKLLVESTTTIPHYYLQATVFCDRLVAAREHAKRAGGDRLTVDALLIWAAARAIARFPGINRHLRGETLHVPAHVNIAVATSVGDDLVAPVVRDADRKDATQINREVLDLTAKARDGKLERSDTVDATFTVSNLGRYAVDAFQAIITPLQSAILAVGRIQKRVDIGTDGSSRIRPACTICVSFDHRVINGAQGAEFLTEVKRIIEEEISES